MADTWHVVETKPGRYQLAEDFISRLDYQVFNPKIRIAKNWSRGRRRESVRQYIPGYLFVHFDLEVEGWQRINWSPGVRSLMYLGPELPATVPDAVVELILSNCELGTSYVKEQVCDRKLFVIGQTVRVLEGPFASFNGPVTMVERNRVTVLLSVFGRSNPITFNETDVVSIT